MPSPLINRRQACRDSATPSAASLISLRCCLLHYPTPLPRLPNHRRDPRGLISPLHTYMPIVEYRLSRGRTTILPRGLDSVVAIPRMFELERFLRHRPFPISSTLTAHPDSFNTRRQFSTRARFSPSESTNVSPRLWSD